MPRKAQWPPPVTSHKGYDRLRVTVDGVRRDFNLGPTGSSKARKALIRRLAELEVGLGRPSPLPQSHVTTKELVAAYLVAAEKEYSKSQFWRIKRSLLPPIVLYGDELASQFGPLALEAVRTVFVKEKLSRKFVNKLVGCIRAAWRWGSSKELVPHAVSAALSDLADLRQGRTTAPEHPRVEPADPEAVAVALPFLLTPLQRLVQFQLATGTRPGEACLLRPMDIIRPWKTIEGAEVWLFDLIQHKNRWRGHRRQIPIGPEAQEIIRPLLNRAPDAYCFSPIEAIAEFRTLQRSKRKSKVQPSQVDRSKPRRSRPLGQRYTTTAYGHAVKRACLLAGVKNWSPNQLRHLAATDVERVLDRDFARCFLGHRHEGATAVYAEGLEKAAEVAARYG